MSAIVWAFPRGEIILGYWRCLVPLKNQSGQLITKLAQKLARLNKKPNETQTFPTHSHYGQRFFLEGNEGNMEEIGGRTRSWENL